MSWASRACWATRVAASRCAYDATHTPVAITITPAISSAGRRKRSGRSREGRRAITTLIGAPVRALRVHELPAASLCNGVLKLKFRAPIARGQDTRRRPRVADPTLPHAKDSLPRRGQPRAAPAFAPPRHLRRGACAHGGHRRIRDHPPPRGGDRPGGGRGGRGARLPARGAGRWKARV